MIPSATVGGDNDYDYGCVGGNPLMAVDPLGLQDMVVAIWLAGVRQVQVGHVYMGEMDGAVITSQFPDEHRPHGVNGTLNWGMR